MQIYTHTLPGGAQLIGYLRDRTVEMPAFNTRPAILILPGGGYAWCSRREADPVAMQFRQAGYNVFTLYYTCRSDETVPALRWQPLIDAAGAILHIRRNAEQFGTDPAKIAICGFSAGGHLAASTAILWDAEPVQTALGIHGTEARPDAVVLGYPVITAGGIFDHKDVLHQFELGAEGVQAATRFVTTEECDADIAYKEAYINAKEEDIVIVKSPVGMPGRAIKNKFLERVAQGPVKVERCFRCLEHCNPAETPYCITKALINAAEGKIDEALLFCGSNAYRCEKIETVPEVMAALCGE